MVYSLQFILNFFVSSNLDAFEYWIINLRKAYKVTRFPVDTHRLYSFRANF